MDLGNNNVLLSQSEEALAYELYFGNSLWELYYRLNLEWGLVNIGNRGVGTVVYIEDLVDFL